MAHKKAHGGAESPKEGVREYEEDMKGPGESESRSGPGDKKIVGEATERKHGGRMKKHKKKHEMKPHGREAHANGGRAPRKSGGACESHVFSSARTGTKPKGRTDVDIE